MSEPVGTKLDESQPIAKLTEHVRTIHFAIVVVSITLLMAVMYADSQAADKALFDLERLSKAGRTVLIDTNWLAPPPSGGRATDMGAWEFPMPVILRSRRAAHPTEQAVVILVDNVLHHVSVSSVTVNGHIKQRKPTATLHDWNVFWDSLPSSVHTCKDWRPGAKVVLRSLIDSTKADTVPLTLAARSLTRRRHAYSLFRVQSSLTSTTFSGSVKSLTTGVSVRATVEAHCDTAAAQTIAPRKVLADLVSAPWDTGVFTAAFFALNRLAVHYDLENDSDLGNHLRKVREDGGRIEIVGLDIPASVATRWGALVLLLLMVYFWLHLKELVAVCERAGLPSDLAWIGLFTHPVARLGCWVSTAVLPMVTSIALAQAAWGQDHLEATFQGITHVASIIGFAWGACVLGFIISDTRLVLVKQLLARYGHRADTIGYCEFDDAVTVLKQLIDSGGRPGLTELHTASAAIRYVLGAANSQGSPSVMMLAVPVCLRTLLFPAALAVLSSLSAVGVSMIVGLNKIEMGVLLSAISLHLSFRAIPSGRRSLSKMCRAVALLVVSTLVLLTSTLSFNDLRQHLVAVPFYVWLIGLLPGALVPVLIARTYWTRALRRL